MLASIPVQQGRKAAKKALNNQKSKHDVQHSNKGKLSDTFEKGFSGLTGAWGLSLATAHTGSNIKAAVEESTSET